MNLIRDYRREGKYSELRRLIALGCQMARLLESKGDVEMAAAWTNQLMKMRATDEDQTNNGVPVSELPYNFDGKCSGA